MDILSERSRQEKLKSDGRFKNTPDELPSLSALNLLVEEVGEVSTEISYSIADLRRDGKTYNPPYLYAELVQVAAVAMAMAERVHKNGLSSKY